MSRFEYRVVINDIPNKFGRGIFPHLPHAVTIHHAGVAVTDDNYNVITRIAAYSNGHDGYMPYHIIIPHDNSNDILVTQFLNQYTWHNSNGLGNLDAIAVCVDGNFETQKPTKIQLRKLKQLLDDIQNNWFSNNGWFSFDKNIFPQNANVKFTYTKGKTVPALHWHNEITENSTDCCGKYLIPYIKEYREKSGNVGWGVEEIPVPIPEPTPEPIPEPTPTNKWQVITLYKLETSTFYEGTSESDARLQYGLLSALLEGTTKKLLKNGVVVEEYSVPVVDDTPVVTPDPKENPLVKFVELVIKFITDFFQSFKKSG